MVPLLVGQVPVASAMLLLPQQRARFAGTPVPVLTEPATGRRNPSKGAGIASDEVSVDGVRTVP
jgi:hypothetical protein